MVDDALYAHTPSPTDPEQRWHSLREHLVAVATDAERHASAFGAGDLAWWAGILHDAGKSRAEFQAYLRLCHEQPGKPHKKWDHKGAGVVRGMALDGHVGASRWANVQTVLANVIQGHHGGLLNNGTLGVKINDHQAAQAALGDALARYDGLGIEPQGVARAPDFVDSALALEFFTRMVFSALVDADHGDTERHEDRAASELRGSAPPVGPLWDQFEAEQRRFVDGLSPADAATPVNRVRGEVYDACVTAAEKPPGLYRLTVPTGGGKTRSALAFSLRHAQLHCLNRVITAVPYLTITDQTAKSYRQIFPDERAILEHHSAAGGSRESEQGTEDSTEKWRQLGAQDWDAPLVVTTQVQLFESLLSRRTTVCRKLHRIAKSVIILDEAQTIPTHLRGPIVDVLRELVANYGVTVVLCTATQPDLDTLGPGWDAVEIVPEPAAHFKVLKRVHFTVPEASASAWTWDRVVDEMQSADQALTVVNTVKQAGVLYRVLGDDEGHFHLSARMCGAHRRDVLDEVRDRLKHGRRCRLVSTQLIEAGVDLDFPLLLRAVAPLDRIVQAAGRCNREGKMVDLGRVVVFQPEEGGMPSGAYQTGTAITQQLFERRGLDLNDPSTFTAYFRALNAKRPPDEYGIQALRAERKFEAVAEAFHLIDQNTVSVIVAYQGTGVEGSADHGGIVRSLLAELERATRYGRAGGVRELMRLAQPYVVNLRARDVEESGLATEIADGIWRWADLAYDPRLGAVHGRLNVEAMVVG